MNIYLIKANCSILPDVEKYVPEYMLQEFVYELKNAHYKSINITLMEKEDGVTKKQIGGTM